MNEKLLSLPLHIQVGLGAGYLAYVIAYSGIRDHHKGIDIPFRAAAFGIVTIALLSITKGWKVEWSIAASTAGTVLFGVSWRLWGRRIYRYFLRQSGISWTDDTPSAWSAVVAENSRFPATQISVQLEDRTWLHCSQTYQMRALPFGPFVAGNNGDIAMYVDRVVPPEGDEQDYRETVSIDGWGANLTFIPASRIRQVEMRLISIPSRAGWMKRIVDCFRRPTSSASEAGEAS
ncbi:MAG: hypothetical protein ACRER3_10085 [Pseudomonas fluorescens]|uniref:hypothetical protein n=1 Tax=Sphingopyxis sp. TaxID=1908224 RepID=UPI003D6CEF20